jgi:outer membrane protein TolC
MIKETLFQSRWRVGIMMSILMSFAAVCFIPQKARSAPLTWEATVAETTSNNPDLLAAEEQVKSLQAQLHGRYSPFLPQLSADAGTSRSKSSDSNGVSSGVQKDVSVGLSARQSLFSGWADSSAFRRTEAQLDAALAGQRSVRAQVGFELNTAFVRLLYAQEQLRLTRSIADRRKENVRLVELRYEAGREHKGSFLRSRAAYRQSTFEVSQAERAVRVSQRELASVLGRSEFDVIVATGNLRSSAPQTASPDFTSLTYDTPAYLQSQAQLRAAQYSVTGAKSQYYPSLSASGSLSRRGDDWPPDSDRWSAGVSLSFPFFPGGQNVFNVKSARAQERQAKAELDGTFQSTALALEDAFFSFQDAAERTEVQREFLDAAEVRAQIARSQYTSGLLSFEDWDLIENDLISNQKSWLSSLRDAVIAESNWERVQGKGPLQ